RGRASGRRREPRRATGGAERAAGNGYHTLRAARLSRGRGTDTAARPFLGGDARGLRLPGAATGGARRWRRPGLPARDPARLAPALGKVGDLERLSNRVLQRIATPRDLVALAAGLRAAEQIAAVASIPDGLAAILAGVEPLGDLAELIARALVDEPPLSMADG